MSNFLNLTGWRSPWLGPLSQDARPHRRQPRQLLQQAGNITASVPWPSLYTPWGWAELCHKNASFLDRLWRAPLLGVQMQTSTSATPFNYEEKWFSLLLHSPVLLMLVSDQKFTADFFVPVQHLESTATMVIFCSILSLARDMPQCFSYRVHPVFFTLHASNLPSPFQACTMYCQT